MTGLGKGDKNEHILLGQKIEHILLGRLIEHILLGRTVVHFSSIFILVQNAKIRQ